MLRFPDNKALLVKQIITRDAMEDILIENLSVKKTVEKNECFRICNRRERTLVMRTLKKWKSYVA